MFYNNNNYLHVLLQSKDHVFRGHADSVDQLCWHPSHPDLVATAAGDKTVRIWDARSCKPVATIATKGECHCPIIHMSQGQCVFK